MAATDIADDGPPSFRPDLPGGPVAPSAAPPPPADQTADPHAPLAADGPTLRLTPPAAAEPGPSHPAGPAQAAAAKPSEAWSAWYSPRTEPPAGPAELAVDEPAAPSRAWPAVTGDDEATTFLTPPDAPAGADEEPTDPSLRARLDGGETVRLQPPFFAPGTSRLPRHPAAPGHPASHRPTRSTRRPRVPQRRPPVLELRPPVLEPGPESARPGGCGSARRRSRDHRPARSRTGPIRMRRGAYRVTPRPRSHPNR
nr:hypothetical protein GCM10020092_058040 [Actinoplanes digitatis]